MTRDEIAEKYAGMMCTLDEKPARIDGRLLPFASIAPLDSQIPSIVFSWEAVKRIMEKHGGKFKS